MPKKAKHRQFRPRSKWKEKKRQEDQVNVNGPTIDGEVEVEETMEVAPLPECGNGLELLEVEVESESTDFIPVPALDTVVKEEEEATEASLRVAPLPECANAVEAESESIDLIPVQLEPDRDSIPAILMDHAPTFDSVEEETVASPEVTPLPECKITVPPSDILKCLLEWKPPNCIVSANSEAINLLACSQDESKTVQRSLFIPIKGHMKVYVHGKLLPYSHKIYEELSAVPVPQASTAVCAKGLLQCLDIVRPYKICVGASDTNYMPLWKRAEDCFVDNNVFHETSFKVTCRSKQCLYLVPRRNKRCVHCAIVMNRFKQRKIPANPEKTPDKFKPSRYLNSAEKESRNRSETRRINCLVRRTKRLEAKLDNLHGASSVCGLGHLPL